MNAPTRLALTLLLSLPAFQSSNAEATVPFTRAAAERAFDQATGHNEEAFTGAWTLVGHIKRDETEGEYRANGVFTEEKRQYVYRSEIQFTTDAFGFRAPGYTATIYAWPSGHVLNKFDTLWGSLSYNGISWVGPMNYDGERLLSKCRIVASKAMLLCREFPKHDPESYSYLAFLKLPAK